MPCLVVIHLRGRGTPGDGDWEINDVVQAFPARKTAGIVEARIGNVWKKDLGLDGSKEFLALYLPDCTEAEAHAFEGRAVADISWESHFTAGEQTTILDQAQTVAFQEKAGVVKAILVVRV